MGVSRYFYDITITATIKLKRGVPNGMPFLFLNETCRSI